MQQTVLGMLSANGSVNILLNN